MNSTNSVWDKIATLGATFMLQFLMIYVRLLDENGKHGRRGYWFPYWFKFLAWFLTLGTIATCSVYLVMYGLTFGLLKCYLWLTAVIVSAILSGVFVQPVRIFVITAILSAIVKSPPTLQLKKIRREILENPYDEVKAFKANRYRLDKAALYTPLPVHRLQSRAENIKYHLEQRKLFVEVLIYVVFVFTLVYLVVVQRSWAVYYSTNVARQLVVFGSYTNTISFTEVSSYGQFIEYLNETFFPSLFGSTRREIHTSGMDTIRDFSKWLGFRSQNWKHRRKQKRHRTVVPLGGKPLPTWDEASIYTLRELYLSTMNETRKNITNIYERSWTMDRSVKMIGKPRLRQLRVKNNSCTISKYIKPRENMCFSAYGWENAEKGNFSLWWNSLEDEVLTPVEQKPWLYESSWTSGGIYLVGKHSSYPAGGYILEFAKHLDDCRIILNYMHAFQWIDARTRAVIIEFTLYSVNVNLFSVVHLIAERSASGYFTTSYQIDTAKFMFLASELEVVSICMFVIFVLLIFLFAFRQAVRIGRTSLFSYITKGNPIIDVLIITFGLISVAFIFLRSYYVSGLFNTLERSQNNAFVSFAYAAVWNTIATYILAALVTLTVIKFFQILRFRVVFLQMQETLRSSYRYFFALSLQLIVVLTGFTLFFHLILASYDYQFSTFGRTLSKLIGLIACLGESCDTSVYGYTPWFLAPLFYMFYLFSVLILVVAFFVSVICYFLGRIRKTQIENKYNALAYFKHILTANEKSDILRLRGGGGTLSRICLGDQETYQFPPKYMASNVVTMRGEPIFTRAKVYDFQTPYRVNDLYRFETMKRLSRAKLMSEESEKEVERQIAMKAVVARKFIPNDLPKREFPEKFYRGRDEKKIWVVSTETLLEMKKIADDYGRKKLSEKYAEAGLTLKFIADDDEDNSWFVSALDKKMSELRIAVNGKYKEERKKKRKERKSTAEK